MFKVKYSRISVNASVTYNPARKGAKYSLNHGETWGNHGDLCECLAKVAYGLPPIKDGNTPYNVGSDISTAEYEISVKSIGGGLTDDRELRGLPRQEFISEYFKNVFSTHFLWVTEYNLNEVELWLMNKVEFEKFVRATAGYDNYAKKIRFKKAESTFRAKLNALLEENNEGSVL